MKILPKERLVDTGPLDRAVWNYHSHLGWLQGQRFKLACRLLEDRRYGNLLDAGYGSGIFMPELVQRCDALYGFDVHEHANEVNQHLSSMGVDAQLTQCSALDLPYEDNMFDAIVSISAMEFFDPIDRALDELSRVLKPSGVMVIVCPNRSKPLDLAFRIVTGKPANYFYGDRREALFPALRKKFDLVRQATFPRIGGALGLNVYKAWLFRQQAADGAVPVTRATAEAIT